MPIEESRKGESIIKGITNLNPSNLSPEIKR